ncbi:MAG TPA: hypothetical protein VJ302_15750 [Blastocatellia bacterium]|nr:hypothetical protein [Blastocatellia bacterium]
MKQDRETEIKRAAALWNAGEPLEAGRIIFEGLPKEAQPAWAARILRLVLGRSCTQEKQLDRLLSIVDQPKEWGKAHDAFDSLRDLTLKLDRQRRRKPGDEQEVVNLHEGVVALAELVAKVTYNATDPDDEFDEDSGWWIASSLRAFVDWWKDEDFSEAAWSALSSEPPAV